MQVRQLPSHLISLLLAFFRLRVKIVSDMALGTYSASRTGFAILNLTKLTHPRIHVIEVFTDTCETPFFGAADTVVYARNTSIVLKLVITWLAGHAFKGSILSYTVFTISVCLFAGRTDAILKVEMRVTDLTAAIIVHNITVVYCDNITGTSITIEKVAGVAERTL